MDNFDYTFMHSTDPAYGIQLGPALIRTHVRGACGGPPGPNGQPACSIHNPSDHHMKTWRLNWRSDTGVMERLCDHGTGHPDPDHIAYVRMTQGSDTAYGQGIHGCDGCCRPGLVERVQ